MKRMNKKGFTLIELLAVIVILGILMIAAIPAISNAITKSRKDTYVTNAKKIIDAARTSMASGEVVQSEGGICQYPQHGQTTVINLFNGNENILPYLLERGGDRSSFGQQYKAGYVIIYNKGTTGDYYDYYISLVDAGGNGISTAVKEDLLVRGDIKTSTKDLAATSSIAVGEATPSTQYTCIIQK